MILSCFLTHGAVFPCLYIPPISICSAACYTLRREQKKNEIVRRSLGPSDTDVRGRGRGLHRECLKTGDSEWEGEIMKRLCSFVVLGLSQKRI